MDTKSKSRNEIKPLYSLKKLKEREQGIMVKKSIDPFSTFNKPSFNLNETPSFENEFQSKEDLHSKS